MVREKIVPEINTRDCVGCWACASACDNGAISMIDRRGGPIKGALVASINRDVCTGCKNCVSSCGFISWPER